MFCIPLPFQVVFLLYFVLFFPLLICSLNVFFDSKDWRWSGAWSCRVQSTSNSLSWAVWSELRVFQLKLAVWQSCELLCTWESLDCWSITDISSLQPYCLHTTSHRESSPLSGRCQAVISKFSSSQNSHVTWIGNTCVEPHEVLSCKSVVSLCRPGLW